jgi:hypothetical protein
MNGSTKDSSLHGLLVAFGIASTIAAVVILFSVGASDSLFFYSNSADTSAALVDSPSSDDLLPPESTTISAEDRLIDKTANEEESGLADTMSFSDEMGVESSPTPDIHDAEVDTEGPGIQPVTSPEVSIDNEDERPRPEPTPEVENDDDENKGKMNDDRKDKGQKSNDKEKGHDKESKEKGLVTSIIDTIILG